MTEIQQYLAEEVAIDHRDGHVSRREALRRLGLMGIDLVAATTLLNACTKDTRTSESPSLVPTGSKGAEDAATPGHVDGPRSDAATPADASGGSVTSAITFAGPDGRTLMGTYADAPSPRGAVLVIHENKGLTDHFKSVAGRFGAAGYAALAIDLLSEEGGTASLGDPAIATAALAKVPPARFIADLKAGLDELGRRAPGKKLAAIGFCFGGGQTWSLLASREPRLAAAAPFYGPLPEGADFAGSKAAVLGVYASADTRVNASRDSAKAALEKAGLPHEIVTFPNVDHAFFNDTGPRYDAEQAAAAWARVLAWFQTHLA